MKVILKADIKGVGKKDEVINTSDGHARNYLLPKGLAVEANAENMSKLKAKQDSAKYKKNQEKEEAIKIADKLGKICIAQELEKEYKIVVDKKKIDLKETIKTLGMRTVEIKLFEGVIGKLKIDVISE